MLGRWVLHLSQGIVYLVLAPVIVGGLRWAEARLMRRQGPHPLQFYRDLFKLLGKRPVMAQSASPTFTAGLAVVFTSYALLGFLVPLFYLPKQSAPGVSDLLPLIYLLGLARLAMGLAGMDTGAPFGGLGSSRELFLHTLVEPTLIFIVFALALKTDTTDLSKMIRQLQAANPIQMYTDPSLLLLMLSLALVTLAEVGRLPFDNPGTHLELTMFSKAIHLEYGGPQLAVLEWAEALRLTFFLTLLSNLYSPWLLAVSDGHLLWNSLLILLYPSKLFVLILILAFWETLQVKVRLRTIVTPAFTALMMALVAAMLVVAEQYL